MTDLSVRLAVRAGRRRTPAPGVDRDLAVRIAAVRYPCADVALVDLAGDALPAWRPGSHVDVVLPSGRVRQYSLCDGGRDVYRIAVRLVGDGSREVHSLVAGTPLTLRGPRNAFPLAAAPSFLFLAGGIGITPIAPMVRAAAAAGTDWRLVHTGRTLDSMPLSASLADLDPSRVTRVSDGGSPTPAAELLGDLPAGCAVYCCGPPAMIDAVRVATPAGHRFHSERFSPPPIRNGRPFTVGIAGGPDVAVPADRSALDVVREVRPDVAWSCRQGFCGTCHVPLVEGTTTGDTAGPGRTALCVARASADRIVVDLR
ncbi:PDR/VanB family oxidoreductase [Pseudonocardia endophytica]|uniref:PDR/VanB family oxidoreductase n=1 Tax=Pseudonocardia endophytica TaxID=401976 RepID=UPI001FB53A33|nr:PDR/VanB family oxidoreductase [Pseudonocardia endophytica]